MPFTQFDSTGISPSAAPGAIQTSLIGRQEEIHSLRQNAARILRALRRVRESWSEDDVPPPQERWVLDQILWCLVASQNPPSGDEYDRIAAAGQVLALLVEMPGANFEPDEWDDGDYDLVDFDADLDEAEFLVTGNAW
ncbi:hypothetical protein KXS07_09390 [Inquilinus limosus]|uniref:hypothetical protein n=1 Tax=Inquilinus limosus TaxID=171674 RepID=UPI003F17B99A